MLGSNVLPFLDVETKVGGCCCFFRTWCGTPCVQHTTCGSTPHCSRNLHGKPLVCRIARALSQEGRNPASRLVGKMISMGSCICSAYARCAVLHGNVDRTPSQRVFLTHMHIFILEHTPHCGSRCRTTCLHKTCSSTCHHMSESLLFPCFVFFLCLSCLYFLSLFHLFSVPNFNSHAVEHAER